MSKFMNGLTALLVVSALIFSYITYSNSSPFKMNRQLPIITEADIEAIILDYAFDTEVGCVSDIDATSTVKWFNDAKELKSEIGTASDCRMTIVLKDGSELYIWDMIQHDRVTVGYKDDAYYYQTNVYSEALNTFFKDFKDGILIGNTTERYNK